MTEVNPVSEKVCDHPSTEKAGWRDISSAPKDSTGFWAYQADKGQYECWWYDNWPRESYWMDHGDSEPEPTHWMPLPAPPDGQMIANPANSHGSEPEIMSEDALQAIKSEVSSISRAVDNLASHQEQCDQDGVMVKVSRQALDEVIRTIETINTICLLPAPEPSLLGRETVREETIEECAKIADGWLARHGKTEIQYTSPQEYACDAVADIAENIRALASLTPLKE